MYSRTSLNNDRDPNACNIKIHLLRGMFKRVLSLRNTHGDYRVITLRIRIDHKNQVADHGNFHEYY